MKIRHVQLGTRSFEIEYPESGLMEAVMEAVLSGFDYPALEFLRQGQGSIVDVGANIGCASLFFSSAFPDARVYAIEPSPEAFDLLERNTKSVRNITPINAALSDTDGVAPLYRGRDANVTNSLRNSSLNNDSFDPVRVRRAASLFKELAISEILLLKLDTEGEEFSILSSLTPWFCRTAAIFLEYHSEDDRLRIDDLLRANFTLFSSHAVHPHRGVLRFVSKQMIARNTDWNTLAINCQIPLRCSQ